MIAARATPHELMGNTVFCTSLAGEELGRVRSWGNDPRAARRLHARQPDPPLRHAAAPPGAVLVDAAAARGTRIRFDTEYLSHEQDADGVTATVRDRLTGEHVRRSAPST